MQNALKINLPEPSLSLVEKVTTFASGFNFDLDRKRWLESFHDGKINAAVHHFGTEPWLTDLVISEYQSWFPHHKIVGVIGLMKNIQERLACQPPHCDRARALGLNYFVSLGGTNVKTVFYDKEEATNGTAAVNFRYDEVTPIETIIVDHGWYAYKVNRCHSVEDLEGYRIFFAIKLVNKGDIEHQPVTIDDFVRVYPNLIKSN